MNEQTRAGESALHRACYRNRVVIVEYLLKEMKCNKEIVKTNAHGLVLTPMYDCIIKNRLLCADLLLKYGAKIDFPHLREGDKTEKREPFN